MKLQKNFGLKFKDQSTLIVRLSPGLTDLKIKVFHSLNQEVTLVKEQSLKSSDVFSISIEELLDFEDGKLAAVLIGKEKTGRSVSVSTSYIINEQEAIDAAKNRFKK